MEKRVLLAIGLSVAVLLGWQVLFAPPTPPPAPPAEPPAASPPVQGEATRPPAGPAGPTAPGAGSAQIDLSPGLRERSPGTGWVSEVRTPLYRARFGADGSVRSWTLHYRGPKELLIDEQLGALTVIVTRPGRRAEAVPLTPTAPSLEVGPGRPEGELAFRGQTADGIRVEKVLGFRADTYEVDIRLRVDGAPSEETLSAAVTWAGPVVLLAAMGTVERAGGGGLVVTVGEGKDRRAATFVLTPETRLLREGHAIGAQDVGPDDGVTVMYRSVAGALIAKTVEVKAGRKPPRDAAPLTSDEGPDHTQLLGRILAARDGWPEVSEPPAPALAEPKSSPAGPELKDPQLLPASVLDPGHRWIALESTYFIAAFVAPREGRALRARTKDSAEVGVVFPEIRSQPGRPWEARVSAYVGPKEWNRLTALGVGLEAAQARNYGYLFWFSSWGTPPLLFPWMPMQWFCVPLLWLMNVFATHVPGQNYGAAIILLTVLVKILFYPLTHKSMASMKAMQGLQPQINALRAKYKSDPQRFQREQMELFRKHRVNPMGGCLPMVVQIPIFYALYLTLQFSVELQGAPFLLWITDLSKKDPYYVLPILMGASMLVQQMMTPTVGDPRQRNVMLLMPVIFTFMFLEFPTGLVLYWLVNNVLSIAQQYVIDRAVASKGPAVLDKAGREARKA